MNRGKARRRSLFYVSAEKKLTCGLKSLDWTPRCPGHFNRGDPSPSSRHVNVLHVTNTRPHVLHQQTSFPIGRCEAVRRKGRRRCTAACPLQRPRQRRAVAVVMAATRWWHQRRAPASAAHVRGATGTRVAGVCNCSRGTRRCRATVCRCGCSRTAAPISMQAGRCRRVRASTSRQS